MKPGPLDQRKRRLLHPALRKIPPDPKPKDKSLLVSPIGFGYGPSDWVLWVSIDTINFKAQDITLILGVNWYVFVYKVLTMAFNICSTL